MLSIGSVMTKSPSREAPSKKLRDFRKPKGPGTYTTQAFSFDGTDDFLLYTSDFDISNGQGFSISFWVKDGDLGAKTFFSKRQNATTYWQLYTFQGKLIFTAVSGGTNICTIFTDNSITSNQDSYTNIQVTIDDSSTLAFGTNSKMYINGVEQATTKSTGAGFTGADPFNNSGAVNWANIGTSRQEFDQLDEMAIWSRKLSAAATTKVYNGGKPFDLSSNDGDYNNSAALTAWIRGEETLGSPPFYQFSDQKSRTVWAFGNPSQVTPG